MTSCAVPKCINSTKKGGKMRYFLENTQWKQLWIDKINRKRWSTARNHAICVVTDIFEVFKIIEKLM